MKAISLRIFVPYFFLAIVGSQALAQPSASVNPQPAIAGEPLSVFVYTGLPGCYNEVISSNIATIGSQVIIDFEVAERSEWVCGTPPPLSFESPIGELAAGQYELVLNRTFNGVVHDPVIIPFGVLPSAVSVPAGRWIVPGLGLVLLFFGWCRLRNN